MAIKIQGDNMQYGDTAIATLSNDALTLQSGTSLNAQKLTASNGVEITNHMTAENGVVTVTGQLSASNGLAVSGDVSFEDATFSGDVTLGDAPGDTITVTGRFGSDLIPSVFSTYDLGTSDDQWAEAHVDHGHIDDITSTGTSNLFTVNVTGKLTASNGAEISGDVILGSDDSIKAGSYITYSDATLKENIEVISNPIDKVMSMRGVTYNFKNNSNNSEVGFLAQEMRQSVPEVVYGNGDGNLGIDYAKLTSVLVEAIKTQQVQIQEQQSQIDELKESLLKNK